MLKVYAKKIKDKYNMTETEIYREDGTFFCKFPWYIRQQPTKRKRQ